jgi:hypothetical protein
MSITYRLELASKFPQVGRLHTIMAITRNNEGGVANLILGLLGDA